MIDVFLKLLTQLDAGSIIYLQYFYTERMISMKTCPVCGSQQQDGTMICSSCGKNLSDSVIPPQQPQQFQPQYAQPAFQGGAPTAATKSSSKKLIIIISAIVAVIGITLLILFLFVFKSKKDLIIGTWAEDEKNGSYMRFNKDGTVELDVGSNKSKAVYKIDGDTIIITQDSVSMNFKIDKLTEDKLELTVMAGLHTTRISLTKVSDDAVKEGMTRADLKTANANAKLVFTTLNNTASDLIADNISVDKLDYSGPVSGLPDNDLGRAVKSALKDNGAEDGYVRIYFDPNAGGDEDTYETKNYAMYSKSESGALVGRFPNPPKTVDEAKELSLD